MKLLISTSSGPIGPRSPDGRKMMKLQQKVAKLAAELKYAKEDLAKHKAVMAEKKRPKIANTRTAKVSADYKSCLTAIKKAVLAKYPELKVSPEGSEFFCSVSKPKEQRTRRPLPVQGISKLVESTAQANGFNIEYSDDDSDTTYELIFVEI